MLKKSILYFSVVLLVACAAPEKQQKKQNDVFAELGRDLDQASLKVQTDSPWLSGKAVRLNVVGPIYSSNASSQSRANKILQGVLSTLLTDTEPMSKKTGIDFKQHFSAIKLHNYSSSDPQFTYIPALVNNAFADESALNAIFESTSITQQSGRENAEIGFYLDERAWKNKKILLSGYKTIKVDGKSRSSNWFRLQQKMPEQATVNDVQNSIANMVVFALNSAIREYASVDRGKVKAYLNYEFIVERKSGATYAYIYRDRKKLLARQQQQRLESLDKERVILDSAGVTHLDIDQRHGRLLLVRNENYVGKVELVSIKNSNQRSLIFEANSWDEQILDAYYFAEQDKSVIVTDKRIIFYANDSAKILKIITVDNSQSAFAVDKSRQILFRLQDNLTQQFNASGRQLSNIKMAQSAKDLTVTGNSKYLTYLFQDNSVAMFSLISGQWTALHSLKQPVSKLQQCKIGSFTIAYQDKQLLAFENKPQGNVYPQQFDELIKAVDCDDQQQKLLLLFASGAVQQLNLTEQEQAQIDFSMQYSGFDKQNSQYIGHYLTGDEFIYGGRDNLRIRSSVSAEEVNQLYQSLDEKVNRSSSWLDQAVIDQAIYVRDVSEVDKQLYQRLINNGKHINSAELREFMLEEQLDPVLMSNQIEGFNKLGLSLQLSEQQGLRIVKESETPQGTGLSASQPSIEALGYNVDIVELGQYGFDARIYDTFSSTGMTDLNVGILNVTFSDDGKAIILARNDGIVSLKELEGDKRLSFKLGDDGIRAAAINKDNNQLVVATDKGILKQYTLSYDFYSGQDPVVTLIKEMKSYAGNINAISFINDQKVLTSGRDQILKVWDLSKGEVAGTEMLGHTNTIISSSYDASLDQIISYSDDNTIRVWDLASHEQLFSFKGQGQPFLASLNKAENAVAFSHGNSIEIKNLITRDRLGKVQLSSNETVQGIALGMGAHNLFIAYANRVEVRKVSTGALLDSIVFADPMQVTKVLIDKDYRNLILVEEDDVHLINIGRFMLESLRIQQ